MCPSTCMIIYTYPRTHTHKDTYIYIHVHTYLGNTSVTPIPDAAAGLHALIGDGSLYSFATRGHALWCRNR